MFTSFGLKLLMRSKGVRNVANVTTKANNRKKVGHIPAASTPAGNVAGLH